MFFLLFLDAAAELAEELGERGDAAMLHSGCAEARRACHAMFWDAESGSYRTFAHETDGAFHAEDGAQSELVQALSCRALPGRRSASGSCRCWLRAKTTGSRVRSA